MIDQVITYLSSCRFSVNCIGPWVNTADRGPVYRQIRLFFIENILLFELRMNMQARILRSISQ